MLFSGFVGHTQLETMNSSVDLSRRNPQEDFELIQRIGSGTYGDVYKVKKKKLQGGSLEAGSIIGHSLQTLGTLYHHSVGNYVAPSKRFSLYLFGSITTLRACYCLNHYKWFVPPPSLS